jgi:segregation and condensation protein A
MAQDRLGQQVFARGMPEALGLKKQVHWQVSLGDLLRAYANIRTRESYQPLHMQRAPVLTLEDAYARLSSIMGDGVDWSSLQLFLPDAWADTPQRRRSATASTFAAALELAKRGELEMRQSAPFAPLYLRSKARDAA